MALAATISPEELLEFKRDFEELMEAFHNTVLTQGQNICITNLSRISEYYINIHIYYQKANGRTVQIETMGMIDSRYKKALNIIAHTLWGVVQEADRDESMFLSALAWEHWSEKEYPYILSYNHYCKYIYLGEMGSIRMLLYNRGTKTGLYKRRRIPHLLCSNDTDTLHLGDVLRWGVKGQAHEWACFKKGRDARVRNPIRDDVMCVIVWAEWPSVTGDPDWGSTKCVTSVRVSCGHEEMLPAGWDGYKRGQQRL